MFQVAKHAEDSCPHCPYEQPAQYVEHMYRQGHGTWDQLEEYTRRLHIYREAVQGCCSWVRAIVAKLLSIPEQHAGGLANE